MAMSGRQGVLVLIKNIDGSSYRPLGTIMAMFDDKTRVASLSSGFIESEIALHVVEAVKRGLPSAVVYGRGRRLPKFNCRSVAAWRLRCSLGQKNCSGEHSTARQATVLSRSFLLPPARSGSVIWSRRLMTGFNDRFGDTGCVAAKDLLRMRGNAARAIAATA